MGLADATLHHDLVKVARLLEESIAEQRALRELLTQALNAAVTAGTLPPPVPVG